MGMFRLKPDPGGGPYGRKSNPFSGAPTTPQHKGRAGEAGAAERTPRINNSLKEIQGFVWKK